MTSAGLIRPRGVTRKDSEGTLRSDLGQVSRVNFYPLLHTSRTTSPPGWESGRNQDKSRGVPNHDRETEPDVRPPHNCSLARL